jgi:hypothetical protein
MHGTTLHYGRRWVTTDTSGRFFFDAIEFRAKRFDARHPGTLFMKLLHPQYGSPLLEVTQKQTEWGDLRFEIEPDERTLRYFRDPQYHYSLCGGLEEDQYDRCCEFAYGSADAC